MTADTATPNSYLVVSGAGFPDAIDAYLYGDNARTVTLTGQHRFVTIVAVYTEGGFGAGPQADRLASGLYGTAFSDTHTGAAVEMLQRAILAGIAEGHS